MIGLMFLLKIAATPLFAVLPGRSTSEAIVEGGLLLIAVSFVLVPIETLLGQLAPVEVLRKVGVRWWFGLVVASAAWFGLWHLGAGAAGFLVGLCGGIPLAFCYLAWRRRSILFAIVATTLVHAGHNAVALPVAWTLWRYEHRHLTMQEQFALGHDPDWVVLDLQEPEIAAAVNEARRTLDDFTKRVPRYDRSAESPGMRLLVGKEEVEKARKDDERRAAARLDPPEGPRYAIRVNIIGMKIPEGGMAMPHVWLPHVRYDESEGTFRCLPPENPPPWFRSAFAGLVGFHVPPKSVADWRIETDGRVEGAYTTRAVKEYLQRTKQR